MKITLDRKKFLDAINLVYQALSTHNTLPIIGNVKLVATREKGIVVLTATDLENFIAAQVPAEIEQDGATTLPGRLLRDFVARISNSTVTLELVEAEMRVTGGDSQALLGVLAAEEFPPVPECKASVEIETSSKNLTVPLAKVAHSISEDQTRYVLNGVNLAANGKKQVVFVATSGARLSMFASEIQSETKFDCIIPTKAVRILLAVFDSAQDVTILIGPATMRVIGEDRSVSTALIEGSYPNYKTVIPEAGKKVFACDRLDMIRALETARLFVVPPNIGVRLHGKKKFVEISSQPDHKSRISLLGSELTGQPDFTISFAYRFMLDTLKAMEGETVRIECDDELTPMLIREGALTEVISPVRIN